jgi:hypothetical protein
MGRQEDGHIDVRTIRAGPLMADINTWKRWIHLDCLSFEITDSYSFVPYILCKAGYEFGEQTDVVRRRVSR